MRVYGHVKITKKDAIKVGDKDAVRGELAWQEDTKSDPVKFGVFPFLIFGKSGESISKYANDKHGNPRYLFIEGSLKSGKSNMYIEINRWEFTPFEAKKSDNGNNDVPDSDPFA